MKLGQLSQVLKQQALGKIDFSSSLKNLNSTVIFLTLTAQVQGFS